MQLACLAQIFLPSRTFWEHVSMSFHMQTCSGMWHWLLARQLLKGPPAATPRHRGAYITSFLNTYNSCVFSYIVCLMPFVILCISTLEYWSVFWLCLSGIISLVSYSASYSLSLSFSLSFFFFFYNKLVWDLSGTLFCCPYLCEISFPKILGGLVQLVFCLNRAPCFVVFV